MGVAQAAHAENWVQFYGDSAGRNLYDRDSVQSTGDGHVKVMFRTVYSTPQHPNPNSSIPESQTFNTREQFDDINCRARTYAVLGVWYYDANGQKLGGASGRSPDVPTQSGTVGGLLSQTVC